MRKYLSMLFVLMFVITLAPAVAVYADLEDEGGCTGLIVVGYENADGVTRVGQNWDAYPYPQVFGLRMTIDEETGIKVIWDARFRKVPRLNSYGVYHSQNARSAAIRYTGDLDNLKTLYGDAGHTILSKAKSAKEAIDLAEEFAIEFGVRSGSGGGKVYADKDVAYLIEGWGPGDYAITEYRNAAVAHSNTILNPKIKWNEMGPSGQGRMLRAQEMLNQYIQDNLRVGKLGGQISSAICMNIYRDTKDGFTRIFRGDGNLGSVSSFGHGGCTTFSCFGELPKKHVDLLSILWTTPNYPPFSPFIPFYIGIDSIPSSFAVGKTNKTTAFVELANAVKYNMDMADEVQAFWESFEDQCLREQHILKKDVANFMADGNREAAVKMLTDYVDAKCELAVLYAQRLTEKVKETCLIEVDVSPFRDWPEPPRDRK